MGAYLEKPKTEKFTSSGSSENLNYGISCMQGWRTEMEDSETAIIRIPGQEKKVSFFAVFDGHAGSLVSEHSSLMLLECIQATEGFAITIKNEDTLTKEEFLEGISKGIKQGFLDLDEKLRKIPDVKMGKDKSGCTATCALITEKYIVLANCGDSRSVCCANGNPSLVTLDHKPSNDVERERIEKAGGSVLMQRVNGCLGVARALGDFEFKNVEGMGPTEQLISAEPEFFIKELLPEDEFLILACDGVWDVMKNEDVCNFVSSRLKVMDNLEAIASEVLDTCLHKGSRDNMSIIIITFPAAPKPDTSAKEAEKELNDLMEKKLTELIATHGDQVELHFFYQKMSEENFPGLPPGGGLSAKKRLMEELYKKYLPEKHKAYEERFANPLGSNSREQDDSPLDET